MRLLIWVWCLFLGILAVVIGNIITVIVSDWLAKRELRKALKEAEEESLGE